jgi:hypothetical protein
MVDSRFSAGHPTSVARPDADDALPTIEGRALNFGLVLNAADILGPATDTIAPEHARPHLFGCLDPSLTARLGAGDVVVAEEIRGDDPLASQAIAALAAVGIVALVAGRYTTAIVAGARAAGVVALVVDTPTFLRTNDRVRLDLDAAKVVNLSSGDRAAIRNASAPGDRETFRATLARSASP